MWGCGGSPDALANVIGTPWERTSLSETVEKWANDGVKQLSLLSVRLKSLGTILACVRFPSATRNFSPGVTFQCRLLRCLYSPSVQSHASTSVCTIKNPNTGSHITVWTQRNTTHTDRNGQRCSCGCCTLTQVRQPESPARGNEGLTIKKNPNPH